MFAALFLFSRDAKAEWEPPPTRGHGWIVRGMTGVRAGVVLPVWKDLAVVPSGYLLAELTIEDGWWEVCGGVGAMVGLEQSDRAMQGAIVEVGARRYLANLSLAPFVGAGLSPRLLFFDRAKVAVTAHAALGGLVSVGQQALSVEMRLAQHIVPLRWSGGSDLVDHYWPTELGAFVGYWW